MILDCIDSLYYWIVVCWQVKEEEENYSASMRLLVDHYEKQDTLDRVLQNLLCGNFGGLSLTSVRVIVTLVVPESPPMCPPMSFACITTWYSSFASLSMLGRAVLIIPSGKRWEEMVHNMFFKCLSHSKSVLHIFICIRAGRYLFKWLYNREIAFSDRSIYQLQFTPPILHRISDAG